MAEKQDSHSLTDLYRESNEAFRRQWRVGDSPTEQEWMTERAFRQRLGKVAERYARAGGR